MTTENNLPKTSQEYVSLIKNKLSVLEKMIDSVSGTDARLDIMNKLLIQQSALLLTLNDTLLSVDSLTKKYGDITVPVIRSDVFNKALPAAESGLLEGQVTPTMNPSYLRIYICISVAGVLRVARMRFRTTITEDLNSGAALVAGAAYIFTIPWRKDDYINLRYSVSSGTIYRLLVDELGT